ncbi:MAG TPA: hypothetical protein G4N96_07945 [Chloroflexi bacterium]|nr:hypothetical protein [Chloroflexota bacterium]
MQNNKNLGDGNETMQLSVVVTLEDGNRCVFAGAGVAITVDGKRVNYSCFDGGVLVGEPDMSGEVCPIAYSASDYPKSADDLSVDSRLTYAGMTGG